MADVFDFYVQDDRKISFEIAEPIMLEDNHVTDWVFHIPKSLNGFDMSAWAWWLVYVNARNEKFSERLVLSDDPERPTEYSIATYSVDYGMSIKAGNISFTVEAINADTGGTVTNEWHTFTYQTTVKNTLQGNQAEFARSESDIISALIASFLHITVGTDQIENGAVTTDKIADGAVTSAKFSDLSIGTSNLENEAVTGEKLADNSVTSGKIFSNSVTASKLANGAVTTAKLASGAVTELKLADALKLKTLKDYVTPQMYGAVGDGETDDTQAFQSAINAVTTDNRQALFIPEGIYLITATLNVSARMVIFGIPHTNTSTRILLGANVKKAFNVTAQECGFYNFNIIGSNTTDCTGIDFDMPSDIQYNCDGQVYGMILYELSVGVKLSGRNLAVKNSLFSHCGYGIYCEVTNATRTATFRGLFVDSNRFHNCGENENYSDDTACVYYNSELSTQTHSFYITNNYCDLGTRLFKGSLQGGCISNNYIVYIQTDAIWAVNDFATTYKGTETPLISNNYMEHHGTNSDVAIICNYIKRICISNNYAYGFGGGVIRCNSSSNVTINGVFYRGKTSDPAIYLVGCTNISIRNIIEFYISNQNAVSIRCENAGGTVVSADVDNAKVLGAVEYLNKATQYTYTYNNVNFVYSLYKKGGLVELNCISGTVPAQGGGPENILFTLPDGFHPVSNINFKDTNAEQRFSINTDGELYLNSATTTVSALRGTFVYMAR